jgi:LysM repeat protein
MLNEFAAAGFRAAPAPQVASVASNDAGSQATTATPGAGSSYVIAPGDNFGKIAGKFGVAVQAILEANPDADPRRLAIGQTIQIPTK